MKTIDQIIEEAIDSIKPQLKDKIKEEIGTYIHDTINLIEETSIERHKEKRKR